MEINIFGRRARKMREKEAEERGVLSEILAGNMGFGGLSGSINSESAMRLAAVYCAVNQISNSIGVMPLDVYQVTNSEKMKVAANIGTILNGCPCPGMTHFEYFKIMTESLLLRGNAYSIIVRDENLNPISLIYVKADDVHIIKGNDGRKRYQINGIQGVFEECDMIHLYLHPDDLGYGRSIISYAADCLASARDGEKVIGNFFRSGGNLAGILTVDGNYSKDRISELKASFRSTFENSDDKTPVACLPANVKYQAISVSPLDASLLDSRKFTIVQIAQFFNISPLKLYDLTHTSYNTLEQTQQAYLQDTILPIAVLFQDEMNQKLFKPSQVGQKKIEFNFKSLMATNKEAEAKYYKELLVNGILTFNEVRQALGFPKVEDGDNRVMQMSYTTYENIKNGTYLGSKTDNKLKDEDNKEETPKD